MEPRLLLSVVTVTFDYQFDDPDNGGHGFFELQATRDRLQEAADRVVAHFNDTLDAIEPTGGNTWTAKFTNPADGTNEQLDDLTIAENELRIFAGGRPLDGPLGVGGAGGWSASGSTNWLETVQARGQSGALENEPIDFGPWGGMVSFDTETDWHFGATTDGLDGSEFDFLSVALHEIMHVVGFSSGVDAFEALIDYTTSPRTFEGAHAVAEYDDQGQPPLASGLSHWASGVTDDGQDAAMTPALSTGTRKLDTALDRSALADIGWQMQSDPVQYLGPDLNEDGKPDLVWRNQSTGKNLVWFMDGTSKTGWQSIESVNNTNWHIAGAADMDGDEQTDLIWRNQSTGVNVVWFMNGANKTGSQTFEQVADTNWRIAAVADMDSDDQPDLIWRNQSTGKNLVWFMNGTSKTSWQSIESVNDTNWHIAGAADMDGDDQSDLVWRNQSTGKNLVWYMTGTTKDAWQPVESVNDTDWHIANLADMNQDGDVDLIWRHGQTGTNLVWVMDGHTKTGTQDIENVTNTDWHIAGTRVTEGGGDALYATSSDSLSWAADATHSASSHEATLSANAPAVLAAPLHQSEMGVDLLRVAEHELNPHPTFTAPWSLRRTTAALASMNQHSTPPAHEHAAETSREPMVDLLAALPTLSK